MNMINKNVLRALLLCGSALALNACNAAEPASSAQLAPYNMQLFSLTMNAKSPVDNKNHYVKEFDQAFDAMLAQSALAKTTKNKVPLKKRLMSGPQPDPAIVQDKASGRQYVYYEACQAHVCDETNLAVLYAPASKAMLGRLHMDGKDEFLGKPTAAEQALLSPPKP